MKIYKNIFKPILDKTLALFLIFIFSPFYLVFGFLILIFMGRPIFFTQQRPTKNGKIFKIYKFRTMTNDKDKNGNLLPDSERLKGFGKLMRSLSIDELPQLFNILKGDMSFIGPRPLLVEYLSLYSDFQKQRHDVISGISGLAQIKGRNNLSWKNKFRYDVFYAKNISFKLDLYLIFMTFIKVIKRSDINQKGNATAEKFRGD
jgi:undecaprenyl phosphate N,N'-diacetylbacillosamine 1-phosphate transferase